MSVKSVDNIDLDQFYDCGCFFWSNIYIKSINYHFKFFNEQQFHHDYDHIFNSNVDFNQTLCQVKNEVEVRKKSRSSYLERKAFISANYSHVHPELKTFEIRVLDPLFLEICRRSLDMKLDDFCAYMKAYSIGDPVFRLYQFPVFSKSFCEKLIDEVENFNKNPAIPKERPNTMNKYGVLLNEIGMQTLFDEIREKYLNHLSNCLFSDVLDGKLDSHRAFTVSYSCDTEKDLGFHYDNAEVTLNVSLNDSDSFMGGQVYFCGMRNDPIESMSCCAIDHKWGYGILHRGQQLHGALPIESGARSNLIIWMRSSKTRSTLCSMCNEKSQELIACPAGDYGDGFKKYEADVCNVI